VNELKTRRNELTAYHQNSTSLIQELNTYLNEIQEKSSIISGNLHFIIESCSHLKDFYKEKSRDLSYILQELESCNPIKDSIQKNLKGVDWYIENQDKILHFLEQYDI
jgi:hypothetical protein